MIKAIVSDIEGTTTALSFVKEVLFPYSREHLAGFVKKHAEQSEVDLILKEVNQICGKALTMSQAISQLLEWSDEDKKITPLKALQGLIWEDGYRRGAFSGHIYPDVTPKLKEWQEQGIDLYIYSSGSVQAQRLLFAHTLEGDLTPLFKGYFDTHVGGKRDVASYQAIAQKTLYKPAELLFLSDIKEELDAAQSAGWHTVWLCREGSLQAHAAHPQVEDFTQIDISTFH